MKVTKLTALVDKENAFASAFNRPQLSLQNAQDRQRIAGIIDSQLSPENLTCDGELPRAEVARRYRFLMAAAKELLALDPTVNIYEFS